jgi:hypothetical protein
MEVLVALAAAAVALVLAVQVHLIKVLLAAMEHQTELHISTPVVVAVEVRLVVAQAAVKAVTAELVFCG